jgi:antibiotic biosynthesis monooxygenase (ABM) superfamily enzyme
MSRKTNSHQKLGFSVPENYFTTSKTQILDAIQKEKSNPTPVLRIKPWVLQLAAVFVFALAATWFLRQSNDELSNFDTLLLDSLVIEDDDFADWYEENYVLNDID